MATITQSFTYALPVENYVAGISTTKTATYTYVGPDEFDVEIDGEGYIINFGLTEYPSPDRKKTIKATEAAQLPIAYLARHHFDEDGFVWTENYVQETMDNGDVYNRLDNPDLEDVYQSPRWDDKNGKWVVEQIIKEQWNAGQAEAKRRKSYVETYYSQYDFGTDVNAKIDAYLVGITSYIAANPKYKTWKYTTQPTPPDIPKIDADIMKAFKNLPLPHSFALGGGPTLTFPGETAEG
tara:strand:- start:3744 stop:4457 length:714 start_codon:yes stop_codon:yes gene_type:complete